MSVPTTGPCNAPRLQRGRDDVQQLVTVDDPAAVIDHQHAVAVAVEADADIGVLARHRELQQLGSGGAAAH